MSDVLVTLGQRLKAEREKKGLSAQKAADELNLDGWVVDALESGDYARVGPAVYAKGHLKRYAALLGLPVTEILEAYDTQSTPTPMTQPATLRMRTSAPTGSELPWIQIVGFAVVAVIVAVLMWLKPWHLLGTTAAPVVADVPAPTPASAESADVQGDSNEEASAATMADAAPNAATPNAVTPTAATPTAATPTAATQNGAIATAGGSSLSGSSAAGSSAAGSSAMGSSARPAAAASTLAVRSAGDAVVPGAGRARLRLSFSADSWVDVHDATGQRVYAGNGRANSVKTIAGVAPLRVYLKSASGVQLQINDRAVAIGPQFFAGDVARFEAGADGVLRREAPASRDTSGNRPRG
jgi:cytoskeleton protein RodZ